MLLSVTRSKGVSSRTIFSLIHFLLKARSYSMNSSIIPAREPGSSLHRIISSRRSTPKEQKSLARSENNTFTTSLSSCRLSVTVLSLQPFVTPPSNEDVRALPRPRSLGLHLDRPRPWDRPMAEVVPSRPSLDS
jgi:hypothetical protein